MNQYFMPFLHQIIFSLIIHSLVDRHFHYDHLLIIMSKDATNILVQVLLWMYLSISLGYISRSGIMGSYVNSVFHILRNCQTVSVHFTFPPTVYAGFYFSTFCQHLVLSLSDYSGYDMVSHYGPSVCRILLKIWILTGYLLTIVIVANFCSRNDDVRMSFTIIWEEKGLGRTV